MRYIKAFYRFLRDIYQNRRLLKDLVKNDFKSRYLNNYLGILWAFIQPTISVLIFWFVFQVGFKAAPVQDVPFILWLVAGMIPWFFLSEALASATNAILDSTFLVKKIVFRVSLLPIVKITSAVIVHLFFMAFMMSMYIIYGYEPNLYWLQMFYYLFSAIILLLGISWITSSVVIFFRDLGQLVSMSIQFGFWLTPIFWSLSMVPKEYRWLFELNPAHYITQGYRDALINHVWFWEKPMEALQFWGITLVFFVLGAIVFRKLRPHFADVL
ncbi:ABC transporter permease [Sulfurospirillum multivorans]|uniref:Transport permease protein n=2 Tax=Sulfurospirillum multivorans TaxID=66821 RepID=A0AA86DYZ7_SULMK|nr:ABC transporter permease [Sulfurospirillum multivorans]AHJ13803.1 teichoic acid translocation permease protein TagG [Sulfurospirillum multivorans DSM 12446]QEH07293.1 teichoic acid translocation permease protein TagG [Sulfurospirillum multivorans]